MTPGRKPTGRKRFKNLLAKFTEDELKEIKETFSSMPYRTTSDKILFLVRYYKKNKK
jgi:hypothetical protein